MINFVRKLLTGWEKIDDIPSWINPFTIVDNRFPGIHRYYKGRTFIYKLETSVFFYEPSGAQGGRAYKIYCYRKKRKL